MIHGFSGGGIENSMLRLASGLMDRGYSVEFVLKHRKGKLVGFVPEEIPIREIGKKPDRKTSLNSIKLIRKIRIFFVRSDCFHSSYPSRFLEIEILPIKKHETISFF